ncbi:signal recognition particle-docking protein FtsY [Candidimonas sp. SYP-B2681]|uniref:signal recognition particle-docking protein FtsY n=1 Tax=Candidimonas sp. SYP-B2681 TaxID=2497686 RepID=UPI000F867A16|nr:signal recognition particle-docking protein FtsY [Candidimonas sp. SYP-B2681]RTZ39990.1 signal recognition particle-docking protein FtsY [Candidimonas sp. SYP-B2681]
MFSFFKRKKSSPAESNEQLDAAPTEHGAEAIDAEPAPQQSAEHAPSTPADHKDAVVTTIDAVDGLAATEPLPDVVADIPDFESPVSERAPEAFEAPQADHTHAEAEPVVASPAGTEKASWLTRLKKGLSRTGQSIGGLFVGVKVDEALFEDLETALIMADAGIEATEKLLTALRARVRKERLADGAQVKAALRDILADHLAPLEKSFPLGKASPLVIMIAGVNGAGKTTSIGKLAYAFQAQGAKVLLAAGDTFRAAAREQLMEWGARNNVSVIAQDGGDPAAVAFDAVNAGRAREANVVMVDTAGRLPTQLHLMEELKKIKRVIGKADGAAPHEVLLVIDGNTGQNAIAQIRAFDAAITLTGLVVTKLDGTAKGGTLAAVAAGSQGVRPVPVYWIGVGEGLNDLQPFVAREFATALIGD